MALPHRAGSARTQQSRPPCSLGTLPPLCTTAKERKGILVFGYSSGKGRAMWFAIQTTALGPPQGTVNQSPIVHATVPTVNSIPQLHEKNKNHAQEGGSMMTLTTRIPPAWRRNLDANRQRCCAKSMYGLSTKRS